MNFKLLTETYEISITGILWFNLNTNFKTTYFDYIKQLMQYIAYTRNN